MHLLVFRLAEVRVGLDKLVDLLFSSLQDLCVLVLHLLFLFAHRHHFQLSNRALKLDHVLMRCQVPLFCVVQLFLQFFVKLFLHSQVLLISCDLLGVVCFVRYGFERFALLVLYALHRPDFKL